MYLEKVFKHCKFIISIILFEMVFGKICYEYGYNQLNGIALWYILIAYTILFIGISFYDLKTEDTIKPNIVSLVYIAVPTIILWAINGGKTIIEREIPFLISFYVLLGVALIADVVITITKIKNK